MKGKFFFLNYFLQQLEKLIHAWKCKILCTSAKLANSVLIEVFLEEALCTSCDEYCTMKKL
jgi:hypothetical protein